MSRHFWTTKQRDTAFRMRRAGCMDDEISAAVGRSVEAVGIYLRKHGVYRADAPDVVQKKRERDAMVRQAYPRWLGGESIPALMREVGWPHTRNAMWQALRAYRVRMGAQTAA